MIRPYQSKDLDTCVHLMSQLGYPCQAKSLENRLMGILSHPDYGLLVAEKGGKAVGLLGYARLSFFEKDGYYLRVLALVVDEKHRKQGIATALLDELVQVAKQLDCETLALNSGLGEERSLAHHFYQSYGFVQKSIGFVYQHEELY